MSRWVHVAATSETPAQHVLEVDGSASRAWVTEEHFVSGMSAWRPSVQTKPDATVVVGEVDGTAEGAKAAAVRMLLAEGVVLVGLLRAEEGNRRSEVRARALREAAGAMVRRAVTVALDVDGTLVTNAYPELGEDLGATPWLRRVAARFPVVRFMLWTLRGGSTADEARQWLEERGVTVWAVNRHPEAESWHGSPKAHADLYVDDRALGAPLRADGCVDWEVAGPALMAAVERLVRR